MWKVELEPQRGAGNSENVGSKLNRNSYPTWEFKFRHDFSTVDLRLISTFKRQTT